MANDSKTDFPRLPDQDHTQHEKKENCKSSLIPRLQVYIFYVIVFYTHDCFNQVEGTKNILGCDWLKVKCTMELVCYLNWGLATGTDNFHLSLIFKDSWQFFTRLFKCFNPKDCLLNPRLTRNKAALIVWLLMSFASGSLSWTFIQSVNCIKELKTNKASSASVYSFLFYNIYI